MIRTYQDVTPAVLDIRPEMAPQELEIVESVPEESERRGSAVSDRAYIGPPRASRIALNTAKGVAGMSMWSTP